jgi:cellulose biosynthesis protein BcsQ
MSKIISFFNHKGGVSKTTTCFNVGWMLASKGKKVILVDTDPQCNLTGMVMGLRDEDQLENFYNENKDSNIQAALSPAFESRPKLIAAVECVSVEGRAGLFLLPGHIRFAEYETTLGIAQELSGSIQTLQNLPGSIAYLLRKTANKYDADYVLLDMSPSLSAINQNLFMISDFFIVPTSPDFFSVMAIDSLASTIPKWKKWAEKAASMEILSNATYPFPEPHLKFLGTIIQKFRPRGGGAAKAFQKWIDEIGKRVAERFIPEIKSSGLLLPLKQYENAGIGSDFCISNIPDFNTLIAKSQDNQTPVFELTDEQLDQQGIVLDKTRKSKEDFKRIFEDLAQKIIRLTS